MCLLRGGAGEVGELQLYHQRTDLAVLVAEEIIRETFEHRVHRRAEGFERGEILGGSVLAADRFTDAVRLHFAGIDATAEFPKLEAPFAEALGHLDLVEALELAAGADAEAFELGLHLSADTPDAANGKLFHEGFHLLF